MEAVCVLHAATANKAARRAAIPCFCNVIRVLPLWVIAARRRRREALQATTEHKNRGPEYPGDVA
ncbi:hypothetical protein GCM10012278_18880 [Nonomuraea glycinis]|uniref:Uncharacterized protein n=1 Tax=Nonomuraea glycinis TaxID=2047744 RepID=A0A918A2G1_9ACTN|nr:hypothetical protein GCM10012278_18880 [Nonomuraea glycinis]